MTTAWKRCKLGDVLSIQNGYAFDSKGFNVRRGMPLIRIRSLKEGVETETRFSGEYDERYVVTAGDLLIGMDGEFACYEWKGEPALLNQRVCRLQNFAGALSPRFLFYGINSYLKAIEEVTGFTTVKHLSSKQVLAIQFPVPPLPEQRRIVAILNETFAGIATARANAEKSLQNARGIFESYLEVVFGHSVESRSGPTAAQPAELYHSRKVRASSVDSTEVVSPNAGRVTKTGGREATLRHIPGRLSLAVGMPRTGGKAGWKWGALSEVARLESGHTPSRKHPEYWGGTIPWIGIQDAREHHGQRIVDTLQKTNKLGIANSSARVLPENTVCLSRTASVGYVVVTGCPMATSQDFVNWVCSDRLNPEFLKYLFLAEGREGLLRYASGSVHQTIYFPEAKAFHICYPKPEEQALIVRQCNALRTETHRLAAIYERKLAALDDLQKSLLHCAFAGELTAEKGAKLVEAVA